MKQPQMPSHDNTAKVIDALCTMVDSVNLTPKVRKAIVTLANAIENASLDDTTPITAPHGWTPPLTVFDMTRELIERMEG